MTDTPALQSPRRAALAFTVLAAVGLGWGAAALLSKIATETGYASLGLTLVQSAVGAVFFTATVLARGLRLPLGRKYVIFYLVCGLVGTALPHTLGYASIRHLPVGVQSIVLSAVPMMTFLLSLPLGLERFAWRRLGGLALGAVAVLMIALPEASLPEPGQALWLILPVVVAASYASENVYIATAKPRELEPLQVMCGLSFGALVLLIPPVWATGAWVVPASLSPVDAALLGASVLHVFAYFGLVWLIGHAGPVFAAQVGYVVTASGVAWGMLVLGERHSAWVWGALVVMFAGLVLVKPRARARDD